MVKMIFLKPYENVLLSLIIFISISTSLKQIIFSHFLNILGLKDLQLETKEETKKLETNVETKKPKDNTLRCTCTVLNRVFR